VHFGVKLVKVVFDAERERIMYQCPTCGGNIATNAKVCPHCGMILRKSRAGIIVGLIIAIIAVIVFFFANSTIY
jgi:predicted nucleic acid-binding Zn ribbon protein